MSKENGFTVWDSELEKELFTDEEIEASNLRVAFIDKMIAARREAELSQSELEELSGLRQSAIARIESGAANPTLDTLIRALIPMGKELAIVPLERAIEIKPDKPVETRNKARMLAQKKTDEFIEKALRDLTLDPSDLDELSATLKRLMDDMPDLQ